MSLQHLSLKLPPSFCIASFPLASINYQLIILENCSAVQLKLRRGSFWGFEYRCALLSCFSGSFWWLAGLLFSLLLLTKKFLFWEHSWAWLSHTPFQIKSFTLGRALELFFLIQPDSPPGHFLGTGLGSNHWLAASGVAASCTSTSDLGREQLGSQNFQPPALW